MPCVTVIIFILQVEMRRVYMMYHLSNKTYCVGMLANGRIEAVEFEKIVNQDVVPFTQFSSSNLQSSLKSHEQLVSMLYISIHHVALGLLNAKNLFLVLETLFNI